LIELHGGRVTLQSEPGEGTRVTCFIPATPPSQDAADAADAAAPDETAPDAALAEQTAEPEAAAGQ